LSIKDFDKAFRYGLGRAYIHVKENGDDGVRDVILRHCLQNPCYDAQCEDARAPWLMSIIDLCISPEFYTNAIIDSLSKTDDDWELSQLFDLCLILAKRGNKTAEKAIYNRFDKQEFNESYLGGDHIVELNGLDGLLYVARVLGKRMLKDEDYWDGANIYSLACETHKKETVDKLLSEQALTDLAVAEFLKDVAKYYKEDSSPSDVNNRQEEIRERARKELPMNLILSDLEKGKEHRSRFMRFGIYATEEESNIVYNKLLTEEREEQLISYLWVFRRREVPALDDKLFTLTKSKNKDIGSAAIRALMHTTHPRIRSLAIELHDSGDDELFIPAIELFVNNYKNGDYRYIEKATVESDDTEFLHSTGYDILNIFEKPPDKGMLTCLTWVYENTPCSNCRENAVKLLAKNKILTESIRQECQFDCVEYTKNFE
jgi:hypothetical protein